jgi:hypothetical protein
MMDGQQNMKSVRAFNLLTLHRKTAAACEVSGFICGAIEGNHSTVMWSRVSV